MSSLRYLMMMTIMTMMMSYFLPVLITVIIFSFSAGVTVVDDLGGLPRPLP